MKIKVLTIYSKVLSFFLILLGFQSCDSELINPVVEYGTPTAKFKVKGRVVSENTEEVLKDIKVVMGYSYQDNGEKLTYRFDSTKTDPTGKFSMEHLDFPKSQKYVLILEDPNKDNNQYESKTDTVRFDNPTFNKGEGNWYRGEAEKDMGTIKLTPVKNED